MLRLRPDDALFDSFQHHSIEVDDVDDENLLEHFPAAIKFIQSGLDAGGGVLVHWSVGVPISLPVCFVRSIPAHPIGIYDLGTIYPDLHLC